MAAKRTVSHSTCLKDSTERPPRVPYAALTHTFSLIESTTKRLEKTSLLTAFFLLVIKRSKPDDFESLLQAVYLCINRVRRLVDLDH
jgi:hypothetical protein